MNLQLTRVRAAALAIVVYPLLAVPAFAWTPAGHMSDKFRHQYWHFIDLPFATTPSLSLPSVPTPNAQERITLFLNTLRSTAPDPLKSYDLTWLLHIVGDLHQPLHGSRGYRMPIGPGNGPFKVDAAYERNKQVVARERAALGAARLAAVLNANLK